MSQNCLCAFCGLGREVENVCGQLHIQDQSLSKKKQFAAHHKCMQYSSSLIQYEFDHFGGFEIDEVKKEASRGSKLSCAECFLSATEKKGENQRTSATAGCAVKKCRKSFHFFCARNSNKTSRRRQVTEDGNEVDLYRIFCSKEHKIEHEESKEGQFENSCCETDSENNVESQENTNDYSDSIKHLDTRNNYSPDEADGKLEEKNDDSSSSLSSGLGRTNNRHQNKAKNKQLEKKKFSKKINSSQSKHKRGKVGRPKKGENLKSKGKMLRAKKCTEKNISPEDSNEESSVSSDVEDVKKSKKCESRPTLRITNKGMASSVPAKQSRKVSRFLDQKHAASEPKSSVEKADNKTGKQKPSTSQGVLTKEGNITGPKQYWKRKFSDECDSYLEPKKKEKKGHEKSSFGETEPSKFPNRLENIYPDISSDSNQAVDEISDGDKAEAAESDEDNLITDSGHLGSRRSLGESNGKYNRSEASEDNDNQQSVDSDVLDQDSSEFVLVISANPPKLEPVMFKIKQEVAKQFKAEEFLVNFWDITTPFPLQSSCLLHYFSDIVHCLQQEDWNHLKQLLFDANTIQKRCTETYSERAKYHKELFDRELEGRVVDRIVLKIIKHLNNIHTRNNCCLGSLETYQGVDCLCLLINNIFDPDNTIRNALLEQQTLYEWSPAESFKAFDQISLSLEQRKAFKFQEWMCLQNYFSLKQFSKLITLPHEDVLKDNVGNSFDSEVILKLKSWIKQGKPSSDVVSDLPTVIFISKLNSHIVHFNGYLVACVKKSVEESAGKHVICIFQAENLSGDRPCFGADYLEKTFSAFSPSQKPITLQIVDVKRAQI